MHVSEARKLVQESVIDNILNRIFSKIRDEAKILDRASYQLGNHGSMIVDKLRSLKYETRWTVYNDLEVTWW